MAQKSFGWDAAGGGDESPYSEADVGLLFAALAGVGGANEGVLPRYESELAPSSESGNTIARVLAGAAMVDGHPYINTATIDTTPVTPSVGTTGRRLVLRCTWGATQTVRLVEISSADGTATIPALTQTSGTTYDIPICSYTVTTGGMIGSFTDDREFAGYQGNEYAWAAGATPSIAVTPGRWLFVGAAFRSLQANATWSWTAIITGGTSRGKKEFRDAGSGTGDDSMTITEILEITTAGNVELTTGGNGSTSTASHLAGVRLGNI